MLADVKTRFDKAIEQKILNQDVRNFLLKHNRKELCIQNLCDEIIRAEKYSLNINLETYDTIIKDIATMFIKAALQKAEEEHMSAIKRQQIMAQADHIKNAEAMLVDLEKETINEKGLTEIERDEIRQAIKSRRKADQVQA